MTPEYLKLQGELKQKIVGRHYRPGSRIPTRGDIMREYGYARVTVDRAINALIKEGYLRGQRGSGTFVIDYEEQERKRTTVYIVLHRHTAISETALAPFLEHVRHELSGSHRIEFVPIQDLVVRPERFIQNTQAAVFCQLDPRYLEVVEAFAKAHCRVLLVNRRDCHYDYVTNDASGGVQKLIAQQGIQRIGAILDEPSMATPFCAESFSGFYRAVAVTGIQTSPDWILGWNRDDVELGMTAMRRLFQSKNRPNWLFISTYAVPYVLSALHAAGLKPGQDVSLIHYNVMPETRFRPGVIWMEQDFHQMGVLAVQWLRQSIGDASRPLHFQHQVIPRIHAPSAAAIKSA